MNLYASEKHESLFNQTRQLLSPKIQNNTEYLSALYLITSNDELFAKMNPYFSNAGFSFEEMFEEVDFSSGYLKLAKLAVNLFNNGIEITPLDLTSSLDQESFQVAINAIYIRKMGVI